MNIFDMGFLPVDSLLTIWVEKTIFERGIVPDQWSENPNGGSGKDDFRRNWNFGVRAERKLVTRQIEKI
jgi:hypothetical protein